MNCRLNLAASKMSQFETGIWNWYFETVNPFTMEAGIVASEFRELRFRGPAKRIALSAMNAIHRAFEVVADDRANKKAQERNNG